MASSYSTLSTKGNERLTLEQIKRKRALADALVTRGFKQTPVAPGGQYTPFAGVADALSSVLGSYMGNKQNKALDAREAELAAAEQAKQTAANQWARENMGGIGPGESQTLVEPELPPGRGPVPLPEELAAPEPVTQPVTPATGPDAIAPLPVAPAANPMHQQLAGALMSAVPELAQSKTGPQTFPLSNTPSPQGEGFQAVADAMAQSPSDPRGQPLKGVPAPGTIPPIVQNAPPGLGLALGHTQDQQDQIGDIEASSMLGDNPDYPPEIVPPGPPIEIGTNGVGTMAPMTVTGHRPQAALLEALRSQQPSAPTGPAVAPELVQALMQKSGLAMSTPMAQAQPTVPLARPPSPPSGDPGPRPAARPKADNEKWIRLWEVSQAVGDKDGMKHALDRMTPEVKKYVIDGALVTDQGQEIYKGRAKLDHVDLGDKIGFFDTQGNLVRTEPKARAPATPLDIERILAARGIVPGTPEHDAALKLAQEKATSHGAGVKIENYGGPTAGVDAQGNPVFFQPSNKGGAPNIMQGVAPAPKEKAEKVLPTKAMTNIEGAANAAEDTERFVNTFKPEYGGHFILGKLSNTIGRTVGDASGQAQWWQDLESHQNIARHELFGSALTKTELGAWNATAVNPSMNAGEIKKNLERRQTIERRAAAKIAKSYMAQGYNKEGIRELLGPMADYILDTPTPTVGKPKATRLSGVNPAAVDMAREQQDAGEPTPPSDLPAGTTLYKTLPNGNPVWLLPDGKKREQHL